MIDNFKIYIDRLRAEEEKIEEILSPFFMQIEESDLAFKEPIELKAKAYLTDDNLVFQFTCITTALMPCAICNEDVKIKIEVKENCQIEPLENIKGGIFDFKEIVREAILLELPLITECHEGNCPERANMAKYLSKNNNRETEAHPFSDL
jgi:uncharacterized metal-binding protein YceD (DUF177 family)